MKTIDVAFELKNSDRNRWRFAHTWQYFAGFFFSVCCEVGDGVLIGLNTRGLAVFWTTWAIGMCFAALAITCLFMVGTFGTFVFAKQHIIISEDGHLVDESVSPKGPVLKNEFAVASVEDKPDYFFLGGGKRKGIFVPKAALSAEDIASLRSLMASRN